MWFVYLLHCGDQSLYCGITNNRARRLKQHQTGKGAKYTASRLPVILAWYEVTFTKSKALKREAQIKRLSRKQKLKLIGD